MALFPRTFFQIGGRLPVDRQDMELHASILLTTHRGLVGIDRFVEATPNRAEAQALDTTGPEPLDHSRGAGLAQPPIVFSGADGIGVPLNHDLA